MKLISFIMPTYKTRFLKQAIESILIQSFSDFELIIIDDASAVNIEEIVLGFAVIPPEQLKIVLLNLIK